jgi:anti-anti-sigma factor
VDLTLATRDADASTIITVGGEIDVYTAPKLRDLITELVGQGRYHLVVDMSGVEFLDSTGLGVLVGGLKKVRSNNGSLHLVCTTWASRSDARASSSSARCSPAAIGYLGMSLAVKANVRVASPPEKGRDGRHEDRLPHRWRRRHGDGRLGLLGASIVVLLYKGDAPKVLEGFGFGAALLAMFMRVGGGIFTKAADVGADLVGKVEAGIPEDDPRNAATIADNVGDNVGDCAGMAADLFESYAVTLVAALILGSVAFGEYGLVFPLIVPAIGAVTALLGVFITKARPATRTAWRHQPRLLHLRRHLGRAVEPSRPTSTCPRPSASSARPTRRSTRSRATRASPRSSRCSSASCSRASSSG